MESKKKELIISIIVILSLVITVLVTYKKGYLGDIFKKNNNISIISNGESVVTKELPDINKNEVNIINKGETAVLEYDSKSITGVQDKRMDYRYTVKYIDSYVTREIPSGMGIDYYSKEEKMELDNNNGFKENYYYVMVGVEITNELEGSKESITPMNITLGCFSDNIYKSIDMPRGIKAQNISSKGEVNTPYSQSTGIELCYIVTEADMQKELVVQNQLVGSNKIDGSIPYLIIDSSNYK